MGKNEVFDGTYCYFIHRFDKPEWVTIGTCNADDHWEALDKFKRGLGTNPMERGKTYRIVRDAGKFGKKNRIQFVY